MSPLVGSWNVADTSGGMIQFGFGITDVTAGAVTGAVQRVFAGNVGIDATRFGPLRGVVTDSRIILRAEWEGGPPLELELDQVDEGLRVAAIRWAGESLVREPNTWVIWRD